MAGNKKRTRRIILGAVLLLLLILFVCLCWQHRKGIRNTVYRLVGIEEEAMKSYGYYGQEIDVTPDLDEVTSVLENDAAADRIETTITKEPSLVSSSCEIDAQIEEELSSGNYGFDDPLVLLNPFKISPLTGIILFQTEEPCAVRVTVRGKTEAADITGEVEISCSHRVPLVGLYPSAENTVVLELLDESGDVTQSEELLVETSGLPEALNNIIEPVTTSGTSAYGLTMVYGQKCSYPFAYDCNGDIRWYLEKETANYGLYSLSDGRLIFQDTGAYTPSQQKPQSTNLYEIDYLGRVYALYYLPNGSHHEVIEKEPGGNLLCLTSTLKEHYEDAVVEIDRETGEIVNKLELETLFDSTYVDMIDWAHINTVSYQADTDTVLLSVRNLHSVIKLNWTTHEIVWILCDPQFWEDTDFAQYVLQPEEDFSWHYQQHSAYQLETDLDGDPATIEISLFDNHNDSSRKLSSFDQTDASYATVYSIDEAAGTVRQLRRFPVIYSKITSNAIYDAQSNHIFAMCGWTPNTEDKRRGMTYEFDYETGELLNQFSIKKTFYRATPMTLNYDDLAAPMEVDETYIKGSLKPAVPVTADVEEPTESLSGDVTFKLIGSVLYVGAADHHISQIIFRGESHTYVYDSTQIRQHSEEYLAHEGNIPVPLTNFEADTYEIFCVYADTYCQTGERFTIKETTAAKSGTEGGTYDGRR